MFFFTFFKAWSRAEAAVFRMDSDGSDEARSHHSDPQDGRRVSFAPLVLR